MSESDFIAAQSISAQKLPADGSRRTYLLVGLLRCGICGRSMQSQLSHGNPAYRCRHGNTSAHTTAMRRTGNLYLREDVILGRIFAKLHTITSRDAGIAAEIAQLRQHRNVPDLIRFLRAHHIVLEASSTGLTLEPQHEKSNVVESPASGWERAAGIPRQRIRRTRHRQ